MERTHEDVGGGLLWVGFFFILVSLPMVKKHVRRFEFSGVLYMWAPFLLSGSETFKAANDALLASCTGYRSVVCMIL